MCFWCILFTFQQLGRIFLPPNPPNSASLWLSQFRGALQLVVTEALPLVRTKGSNVWAFPLVSPKLGQSERSWVWRVWKFGGTKILPSCWKVKRMHQKHIQKLVYMYERANLSQKVSCDHFSLSWGPSKIPQPLSEGHRSRLTIFQLGDGNAIYNKDF